MPTNQAKSAITERRQRLGWSIYELAKRTGACWETIKDAEKGRRTTQPETRRRIEQALEDGERAQHADGEF